MVNIPGAPTSNPCVTTINSLHRRGQYLDLGYGFAHLVFNFWHGGNKWAQVHTEYGDGACILPKWMWCSV